MSQPDAPGPLGPRVGGDEDPAADELARRAVELHEQTKREPEQLAASRAWYRSTATVVSVLAAVVSIISAGLSYLRGQEQEMHNRRMEFTALIQRMTTLQDDPNDEYQSLAKLAPQMIKEIEPTISLSPLRNM